MENTIITKAPPGRTQTAEPQQPAWLRFWGHLFSYVFHPLFIPVYVTAFLLYLHPYAFAGVGERKKIFILISVFFSTTFLPAFSVFLMKQLGFIQSIFLRTQKERIIPYAAAIIFYFWIWYVFRNQQDAPPYFVDFLLGTFLAVCAAWMFNINYKISMHSTGVGGLVMFFLIQVLTGQEDTGVYLSFALLIAGLVCTARFLVSDHTAKEIYSGFFAGVLCQLIAWWL